MPWPTKSTKGPSTSMMAVTADEVSQDQTSLQEESEPEQEVFIKQSHPQVHQPVYPSMYMPYIEGQRMDWMVNDALYQRFIKWKLKCENVLECKLAALPECQKCKKVIAWSGNFWMNQYISWGLSKEEMNLDTIWERFKDFCKPQSNEVRARFNLLTSFHQGNKSVSKWCNAVQAQVNLTKYSPRQQKYCTEIFSGFSYEMKFLCLEPLQKAVLI